MRFITQLLPLALFAVSNVSGRKHGRYSASQIARLNAEAEAHASGILGHLKAPLAALGLDKASRRRRPKGAAIVIPLLGDALNSTGAPAQQPPTNARVASLPAAAAPVSTKIVIDDSSYGDSVRVR